MRTGMRQRGFTGLEILIAVVIISAIAGGVGFVFKEEVAEFFKKDAAEPQEEEAAPVRNPFPTRPPGEPGVPQERSTLPDDQGQPITTPAVTAAGEWHGTYTVSSSGACSGVTDGWEAFVTETNGVVGGRFAADSGFGGTVSGTRSGTSTTWGVGGGGSGVSFTGTISGNTISGTFSGPECPLDASRTSGSFFGGRVY